METKPETKTSRRAFVGGTTVASALAAGKLVVPQVFAQQTDELRIAMVGCGGRGTGAAMQAMNVPKHIEGTKTNVKVVAMADAYMHKIDGSLNRLKKEHGDLADVADSRKFAGPDAYKAAIDAPGVNLVILATPPGFRPVHLDYAIKAGKHVFMEKPVAVDAWGVNTVLAATKMAKEKNLMLAVGLQRHHENRYIETIKRVQEGAIGPVQYTRVYWNGGGVWTRTRDSLEKQLGRKPTEMEYQLNNWYYFNWLCGDHICEQHIHNLDVSNWLMGEYPTRAEGMGGRQVRTGKENGQIFDHFFIQYDYASGRKMFSQCRHIRGCSNAVTEYAHGPEGTSQLSGSITNNKGETIFSYRKPRGAIDKGGHQNEWYDLVAAIDKGEVYNEGEYGAMSSATAVLGRVAAYTGKAVTMEAMLKSNFNLAPESYALDATPPVLPDAEGFYPVPMPGQYKPFKV